MAVIGIDLGTSNSLVGYYDGKKAHLIPNVFGDILTPSVISIDDNGDILTGKIAKQRLVSHPNQTFSAFKRDMGTNKKFEFQDKTFNSTDLSSFVLKQLKQDAETYLNEICDQAIISVPAYFNNKQRQSTIDAAKLAGLRVLKLISEPTAAALAHGLHEFVDDSIIIVLDLGGGTFDVSIMEMFDGILQVLTIAGDNRLGGEDFTQLIVKDFLESHQLTFDKLSPKDRSIIYDYCELIKHTISMDSLQSFTININNKEHYYELSYEQFQNISENLLGRIRMPILSALNNSNLTINDIDQVILMGGSTKLALIRNYTEKLFNKKPRWDINPDQTVGIGVVLSTALHLKHTSMDEIMMTDICGFTLGVSTSKELADGTFEPGVFSPIINRNATLPVSKVETFVTLSENSNQNRIRIYQGESPLVKDNLFLGELIINFPRKEKDQPMEIRFTYDLSGILEVEATVLETKEVFHMVLKDDGCSLTEAEIEMKLHELNSLKEHPRDKQQYRLLLAQLDKLYELVKEDRKAEVENRLLEFIHTLDGQDEWHIKKASAEISKFIEEIKNELNAVFTVKYPTHLN